MKKDPAIEQIRQTRREISRRFGDDTRALIEHYQQMESQYADRLLKDSKAGHAAK
ncbi:MAG: hypothetical protein R6V58_08080 [Planctomycetota bacterium]